MLTQVDYRSGRMHDMDAITRAAHDAGAVMIWDLAHSAGAVPVDIAASRAEFAVGCALTIGAGLYIWRREIVLQGEPVPAGN